MTILSRVEGLDQGSMPMGREVPIRESIYRKKCLSSRESYGKSETLHCLFDAIETFWLSGHLLYVTLLTLSSLVELLHTCQEETAFSSHILIVRNITQNGDVIFTCTYTAAIKAV